MNLDADFASPGNGIGPVLKFEDVWRAIFMKKRGLHVVSPFCLFDCAGCAGNPSFCK
jgi:hypothetical protein